jgi:hypothetical protein
LHGSGSLGEFLTLGNAMQRQEAIFSAKTGIPLVGLVPRAQYSSMTNCDAAGKSAQGMIYRMLLANYARVL